jgi:AcrR family transcriptional regulator
LANEQLTKKRIIDEAGERFLKYGYSKLIMDELAADLGISKKTIYKFFPSKQDLVKAIILEVITEAEAGARDILHDDRLEYVEKLKRLLGHIGSFASRIGLVPGDIQKNAPEIWVEIEEIRKRLMFGHIRNLLQEGIATGVIKNNINQEILVLIFLNSIRTIINPKVLSGLPYSMKEAFDTITQVIFNGILTEGYKVRIDPSSKEPEI